MSNGQIHKYYLNNRYIVLDVNSGGVHIVDKIVYDILDYYKEESLNDILARFSNTYDSKSIGEVYGEISELEKQGLLFSQGSDFTNIPYNEDNIIKAMCLHIAHDCNLTCKYCFASQGDFKGGKIPYVFRGRKEGFGIFGPKFWEEKKSRSGFFLVESH